MNILYLLLGWLLGLFSPIVVEKIRRPHIKGELKKAFFAELKELRLRIVFVRCQLASQFGPYDRELLTWVQSHLKECTETELNLIHPDLKKLSEILEKLLQTKDEQFAQLEEHLKKQAEGAGLSLKKYSLSLITANIGSLTLFRPEFQVGIFEIISRINLLNQEIDNARFYFENTFNANLSDRNQAIIGFNLKQCYQNIARQVQILADNIKRIMSQ